MDDGERQRLASIADSLPGLVGFVDMDVHLAQVVTNLLTNAGIARARAIRGLAVAGDSDQPQRADRLTPAQRVPSRAWRSIP